MLEHPHGVCVTAPRNCVDQVNGRTVLWKQLRPQRARWPDDTLCSHYPEEPVVSQQKEARGATGSAVAAVAAETSRRYAIIDRSLPLGPLWLLS